MSYFCEGFEHLANLVPHFTPSSGSSTVQIAYNAIEGWQLGEGIEHAPDVSFPLSATLDFDTSQWAGPTASDRWTFQFAMNLTPASSGVGLLGGEDQQPLLSVGNRCGLSLRRDFSDADTGFASSAFDIQFTLNVSGFSLVPIINIPNTRCLSDGWYYVCFSVVLHSSQGEIELRLYDEFEELLTSYVATGLNTAGGGVGSGPNNVSDFAFRTFRGLRLDDLVVRNAEDSVITTQRVVLPQTPVADGPTTEWTSSLGSNFSAVAEEDSLDDASVVASMVGARDVYEMSDTPTQVSNSAVIEFLQVDAIASGPNSGSSNLRLIHELAGGGATGLTFQPIALTGSSLRASMATPVVPLTGANWTKANLDSDFFGMELA